MKRIANIIIWCVLVLGVLILLSFVDKKHDNHKCKDFQVFIDYSDDIYFLTEAEIKKQVYDKIDYLENLPLAKINIAELEEFIESNNYVKHADAYTTIEGAVRVSIEQRKPIMRIIDRSYESFYVDESGHTMPLKSNYTARVLVINGNLESNVAAVSNQDLSIEIGDSLPQKKLLHEAYVLGKFIKNDIFWNAMIDQIYVTPANEFELVPKIGEHVIIFGNIDNMEEKFNHLLAFYKKGIGRVGWDKYKSINVKYKNQIVCKKIKND